jgi:hypothetical protein
LCGAASRIIADVRFGLKQEDKTGEIISEKKEAIY